jgi:hypothetical protein
MTSTVQSNRVRRGRPRRAAHTPARRDRIRWSRVMVAQARLAAGFYDRPEVSESVVESLWEELRRN